MTQAVLRLPRKDGPGCSHFLVMSKSRDGQVFLRGASGEHGRSLDVRGSRIPRTLQPVDSMRLVVLAALAAASAAALAPLALERQGPALRLRGGYGDDGGYGGGGDYG